jgi:hypothetical protein
MNKITQQINHNLSQKLVSKANYENKLEDENENFNLAEWLFEEAK